MVTLRLATSAEMTTDDNSFILSVLLQPCLPVTLHRRSHESVEDIGMNESVQWKPDSTMLVVAVS